MTVFYLMRLGWLALDAGWWLLADRAVRRWKPATLWRCLVAAFAASQLIYCAWTLAEPFGGLPDVFPMLWHVSGYVWHLGIVLTTALLLAFGYGGRAVARRLQKPPAEPGAVPTRRSVLGAAVAALPPIATAGFAAAAVAQLGHFRVRRERIVVPGLPKDLDGVTIAHVSDLHVGKFLPRGMAKRVADATNALKADVVAFTGDLIDLDPADIPEGVAFLRQLDPRGGLVMIEGNHDMMVDAERFEREVAAAGFPVLLDATKTLSLPGRPTPLQFAGITWGDWKFGREIGRTRRSEVNHKYRVRTDDATFAAVRRVAALRSAGTLPVLLAHHPHAFDEALRAGFPLTLAGHSHGGQLMLNERMGIGPLRFRYWTGLYQRSAGSLFVNNGVGNWFPVRINAPAEIAHLTLVAG